MFLSFLPKIAYNLSFFAYKHNSQFYAKNLSANIQRSQGSYARFYTIPDMHP